MKPPRWVEVLILAVGIAVWIAFCLWVAFGPVIAALGAWALIFLNARRTRRV